MKAYELSYTARTGIVSSQAYHNVSGIDWLLRGKSITFRISIYATEAAFLENKEPIDYYVIPVHNNHYVLNDETKEVETINLYDQYNFDDRTDPVQKLDQILKTENFEKLGWQIPNYKVAISK